MMSKENFGEKIVKKHPRLNRIIVWCSFVAIILGYIATILGKVVEVRRILFEIVGHEYLLSIHFGMTFLVIILFFAGYSALGVWIYRKYLVNLRHPRRTIYAGILCVGGCFFIGGSIVAALPPAPNVQILLRDESLSFEKELLSLRAEGGGLRYNRLDHSVGPQAWATAQSLYAILAQRLEPFSARDGEEIRTHFEYFERVQLPDDEGWGYMEPVDWGVTEIAAWIALAQIASIQAGVVDTVWGSEKLAVIERIERVLRLLQRRQMGNGSWAPIAKSDNEKFARTYSTVMALWAFIEAKRSVPLKERIGNAYDEAIRGGIRWLLAHYDEELQSWVPNPERTNQIESFPGLTAQVLFVLLRARDDFQFLLRNNATYVDAHRNYLASIVESDPRLRPALINRSASENDRTHDSDRYLPNSKFMVEGSTFLWFPWAIALCTQLQEGNDTGAKTPATVGDGCGRLFGRINELVSFARKDPFSYVMAESLLALRLQLAVTKR